MEEGLLKVYPDKEKARSILKMAKKTLEMIRTIDAGRFPSNVIKEYYDVIRELISVVMLLDGCKTYGERAHAKSIEYLGKNYKDLSQQEIVLMDELRVSRNRISYDGFFVSEEYVARKKAATEALIGKLVRMIDERTI